MKKKISIALCSLLILISTTVFASTPVKMEIVENNICNIKLNENSKFEKKIISSDLEKKQVTLQLQINNDAVNEVPEGELMLVIDSSDSMNTKITDTSTRKDLVLNSANKLVENLLSVNSSTLKIGVVTFSASQEQSEMGTEKDAQLVTDFTNDLKTLKAKISSIEGTGAYTDLDSGLKLAQKSFTSAKNNKYIIVLTDGVPNMNVGNNDLVSIEALEKVISTTKETLLSLKDINVISLLTGINDEKATVRTDGTKSYTYGQVIEGVFGTEEKPTIGKFYNINDTEIEKTITEEIYSDLVPVAKTLKDITVVDYFPKEIVENFDMAYVKGTDTSNISTEIDKETNSITWTIPELEAGKSINVQYTLTLKDKFDEKIIDKILNTNQKVEINYKDFDNTAKTTDSDITPKIKLTEIKTEEPKTEPTKTEPTKPVEPKKDDTKAPEELPKTGAPILIGLLSITAITTITFAYKSKKSNF